MEIGLEVEALVLERLKPLFASVASPYSRRLLPSSLHPKRFINAPLCRGFSSKGRRRRARSERDAGWDLERAEESRAVEEPGWEIEDGLIPGFPPLPLARRHCWELVVQSHESEGRAGPLLVISFAFAGLEKWPKSCNLFGPNINLKNQLFLQIQAYIYIYIYNFGIIFSYFEL